MWQASSGLRTNLRKSNDHSKLTQLFNMYLIIKFFGMCIKQTLTPILKICKLNMFDNNYQYHILYNIKLRFYMSRYTGPRLRLVRRLGELPGLTSKESKKKGRPGQHGASPRKKSEYAIALEEKQKIRFNYGISERQLKRYMTVAVRSKNLTWDALLELCEMRLDNVVFRLGFARSIPAARQLVLHKHILVNNKCVNIPSFQCKSGVKIIPNSSQTSQALVQSNLAQHEKRALPEHLNVTADPIEGSVVKTCSTSDVLLKINARLVVEYYNN